MSGLGESETFLGISRSSPSGLHGSPSFRQGALLKIPSLVFDLEMEDDGHLHRQLQPSPQTPAPLEDLEVVINFLLPSCPAEHQISQDIGNAAKKREGGGLGTTELAQILSDKGYAVTVRKALGGGGGSVCLRNLCHNFVVAFPPAAPGVRYQRARIIIDPEFKDQFVIAKSTPRYEAFLDVVPRCLIMSEGSIKQLVSFLCIEMKTAFQANGVVLPPWRQVDSMLTKWQPRNSIDERPFHSIDELGHNSPDNRPVDSTDDRPLSSLGNRLRSASDAGARRLGGLGPNPAAASHFSGYHHTHTAAGRPGPPLDWDGPGPNLSAFQQHAGAQGGGVVTDGAGRTRRVSNGSNPPEPLKVFKGGNFNPLPTPPPTHPPTTYESPIV